MAVYKRYKGKKISPTDPEWSLGTWYVWARVGGGKALHRALRGVKDEQEALEIESRLIRQVVTKLETSAAHKLARRTNKALRNAKQEFVYILESENYFKIGRTTELAKRLKAISGSIIPFETNLIAAVQVRDSKAVEAELHKRYDRYRERGEWFALDAPEAYQLLRDLIQLAPI
jgi:hypothetical protein